uniref:Uncharacterized protein n=1 Tax=Anguilla anguilla TaxID=7936 RepID=A0A0E9UMK8_ANGAN
MFSSVSQSRRAPPHQHTIIQLTLCEANVFNSGILSSLYYCK